MEIKSYYFSWNSLKWSIHNGTSQIWHLKAISLRVRLNPLEQLNFSLHYKIRIFLNLNLLNLIKIDSTYS